MKLRFSRRNLVLPAALIFGLMIARPLWALTNETYSTSEPAPAPVETLAPVAGATPAPATDCWGKVGDKCTLVTPYNGMRISVGSKKEVLADLGDTNNPNSQEASLHLSEDLRIRVNRGEMTEDEAGVILDELARFDGAAYAIPTVDQLKATLNLPKDTSLSSEEYRELVHVHMQITLGIAAVTASYLSDRMGVEVGDEQTSVDAQDLRASAKDEDSDPPDSPELQN